MQQLMQLKDDQTTLDMLKMGKSILTSSEFPPKYEDIKLSIPRYICLDLEGTQSDIPVYTGLFENELKVKFN